MRQRGRHSAASLSVVATTEAPRPAPPRSLSREAKAVWRATTARFKPEHFVGAEPVLEAYCDGVVLLRELVKQIRASEPGDYKRLAVLMRLQKAQALLIGNLGGKLRLTPRARFDRYSVRPVVPLPKPWDLGRSSHPFEDEPPPATS